MEGMDRVKKTFNDKQETCKIVVKGPAKFQNLADLFSLPHSWFCFVDSSWVSEKDRAGIAWKLVDASGHDIMVGSSSIHPIASPLEAEAFAMRDAVQQVKRHNYSNVAFIGDSEIVHHSLAKNFNGKVTGGMKQIYGYVEDIQRMVNGLHFMFYVAPRNLVSEVDVLAKKARL